VHVPELGRAGAGPEEQPVGDREARGPLGPAANPHRIPIVVRAGKVRHRAGRGRPGRARGCGSAAPDEDEELFATVAERFEVLETA